MEVRLSKTFRIEAAHLLPNVPEGHKCRRLHGHSYRIILGLEGPLDPRLGWVQDYGEISQAFGPIFAMLDHRCLNEVAGLENPTAEVMAHWLFERLKGDLPLLADVTVCETPTTSAVYRPGV